MTGECIDHGQAGTGLGYGTGYVLTESGHIRRILHRIIYHMYYGYWPPVVMHLCDNARCINIEHLQAGDWSTNNKDRARKGRSAQNQPARRTLSNDDVRTIRATYTPRGVPGYSRATGVWQTAKRFGVDPNVIYQIVRGQTYRDVA